MRNKSLAFSLLLLAVVGVVACGDDDTDSSATPTAQGSVTGGPDGAGEVTPTLTPDLTEDPSLSAKILELREEAAQLCPEADLAACRDRYVEFALGEEEVALCTDSEGRWYFDAPAGEIGDDCGGDAVIVAIVGGE